MTPVVYKNKNGLRLTSVTTPLVLDGCTDTVISGMVYQGDGTQKAIVATGCADLIIEWSFIRDVFACVSLRYCKRWNIHDNTLLDFADGVDINSCINGTITGNGFSAKPLAAGDKHHPDCIQIWSELAGPRSERILIDRNRFDGYAQGVGCYGKPAGCSDLSIMHNLFALARPNAIYCKDVTGGSAIEFNRVATLDGAEYQARIYAPGVHREANIVYAGAGKPAVIDA